jgi:hypothetical protein
VLKDPQTDFTFTFSTQVLASGDQANRMFHRCWRKVERAILCVRIETWQEGHTVSNWILNTLCPQDLQFLFWLFLRRRQFSRSPFSSIFFPPLVPKYVRHLIQQTQRFTGADANMRERYCMQIPITTGGKPKIQSGGKKSYAWRSMKVGLVEGCPNFGGFAHLCCIEPHPRVRRHLSRTPYLL